MRKQEAIKGLTSLLEVRRKYGNMQTMNDEIEALDLAIKALKQEPKTGRWLSHREYCEKHDLIPSGLVTLEWCSNCDFGIDINELHGERYNYCPMCGAKMNAESEET